MAKASGSRNEKALCTRLVERAQGEVDELLRYEHQCRKEIKRRQRELNKKWGTENVRYLRARSREAGEGGDTSKRSKRGSGRNAYARENYAHPGNAHPRHYGFSRFLHEILPRVLKEDFAGRSTIRTDRVREALSARGISWRTGWISNAMDRIDGLRKNGTRYVGGKRVNVYRVVGEIRG